MYEGTGIGLAVTREAVQQMCGTIEVDTKERGCPEEAFWHIGR